MQGDPQRTNSARWVVRFCAPLLRCTHLRTVRRCRTSCALPPMCRTHSRRTHARRAARWRRLCSNSADCDTANGYSDKQHKVDKVHSNPNISFHICKTNSGVIEMINNMARHNLIDAKYQQMAFRSVPTTLLFRIWSVWHQRTLSAQYECCYESQFWGNERKQNPNIPHPRPCPNLIRVGNNAQLRSDGPDLGPGWNPDIAAVEIGLKM